MRSGRAEKLPLGGQDSEMSYGASDDDDDDDDK